MYSRVFCGLPFFSSAFYLLRPARFAYSLRSRSASSKNVKILAKQLVQLRSQRDRLISANANMSTIKNQATMMGTQVSPHQHPQQHHTHKPFFFQCPKNNFILIFFLSLCALSSFFFLFFFSGNYDQSVGECRESNGNRQQDEQHGQYPFNNANLPARINENGNESRNDGRYVKRRIRQQRR